MPYLIPDEQRQTEYEIKKSQFIGIAAYTPDRASAMALIDEARRRYPDARHHCWAYLLGNPANPDSVAMADDGEPSGTAGKPILNVLQHNAVGDITIVVVRYFGGIKLGAGGLVRAYSASAQLTLDALPTHELVKLTRVVVTGDFKHEQFWRHFTQQQGGQVADAAYAQQVTLELMLPDDSIGQLVELGYSQGFSVNTPES
ncbi:IMPACT family protein [Salinimonas lutimaris]|uniref:IMPACT family protein n=1 Tax=Salinimonas lutimaris TaxID=914153 RepID=UPI0010BF96A1|nr:YigZ family protein [Salinimonas lutimaris]